MVVTAAANARAPSTVHIRASQVVGLILREGGHANPTIGQVRMLVHMARYSLLTREGDVVPGFVDSNEKTPVQGVLSHCFDVLSDLGQNQAAVPGNDNMLKSPPLCHCGCPMQRDVLALPRTPC